MDTYSAMLVDDAELVGQACAGEPDAFAAIYDRYGPRLHDFLYSVLRDRDEAADVLHDTFLVAGSRLHQLRDPAKLRPWLYAIARHEALRRAKKRALQEPLEETEVTATGPLPDEVAGQGELVELVRSAAEGLSPRDRVVLDLHLRQGLEGQELGEAMGVSAGHAYVLLSRLRDQVERSLGALLVTRLGRDDCEELAAVLEGWDGRFSPLIRKRVARHVDGCERCSDVRSRAVSPMALLAAVPPIALPGGLRELVLGDVELVSHRGRPWPDGRHGFPPPMVAPRRRRRLLGAAAAVVALLGGIAVTASRTPAPVVETEGINAEASTTTVSPATTTSPSTTSASTTDPDPLGPAGEPPPGSGTTVTTSRRRSTLPGAPREPEPVDRPAGDPAPTVPEPAAPAPGDPPPREPEPGDTGRSAPEPTDPEPRRTTTTTSPEPREPEPVDREPSSRTSPDSRPRS